MWRERRRGADDSMIDLDRARRARGAAARAAAVSRRSVLRALGALLVGAAALPLLPVARGAASSARRQGTGRRRSQAAATTGATARSTASSAPAAAARDGLPAGHRDVAGHLDRHLPQLRPTAGTTSSRTTTAAGRASCGRCRCNRNEGERRSTARRSPTTSTGASAARPMSRITARCRASSASPTRRGESVRPVLILPFLLFAGGARSPTVSARDRTTCCNAWDATASPVLVSKGRCRRSGTRWRGSAPRLRAGTTCCAFRASPRRRSMISRPPRSSTGC